MTFTRILVAKRMSVSAPLPLILAEHARLRHPLWVHLPEFAPAIPRPPAGVAVVNRIREEDEDD